MAKTAIPEPGGKPAASRFSAETGTVRVSDADVAIAPLLHRATTLKMRGQWEEAITVATDAVRRAPASATAHALLGDIYAAQNNSDDALHWYRMALARNPHDSGIAQKHELLLNQKRAAITGNMPAVTLSHGQRDIRSNANGSNSTSEITGAKVPALTTKFPLPAGTAERTLEWLDRVFPPGRSEGMARLLFTISGIVVLIVIVTGGLLYFGANKGGSDPDPSISAGEMSNAPSTITFPKANTSATLTTTDGTDNPATASPIAPVPSELMKQLAALQSGDVTITAAETDPAKIQAQLELVVASRTGDTQEITRKRILSAATTASRAASVALPSLDRFSVRVLIKPNFSTATNANSTLVFVGTTSRTALQVVARNNNNLDAKFLASLFTNTWWEKGLSLPNQ